jgi:N-acetyl-anhydromuramyl-L-alanine amidase AmpD
VLHNTEDANRASQSGDAEVQAAFRLARNIQSYHMDGNGWSDTGQHFTISRGGIIMEGRHGSLSAARRGEVVRGAHADDTTYNNEWFGIEIEGDFRKTLAITAEQLNALFNLCAWLRSAGGFDADKLIAHMQIHPGHTDCPGLLSQHLPDVRDQISSRLAQIVNAHGGLV